MNTMRKWALLLLLPQQYHCAFFSMPYMYTISSRWGKSRRSRDKKQPWMHSCFMPASLYFGWVVAIRGGAETVLRSKVLLVHSSSSSSRWWGIRETKFFFLSTFLYPNRTFLRGCFSSSKFTVIIRQISFEIWDSKFWFKVSRITSASYVETKKGQII